MGARNPDLVCPPPRPDEGLTLGEIVGRKWLITAWCGSCRNRVHVDPAALILSRGANYVLWGVRSRCKTWVRWNLDRRCEGRVIFWAQSCPNGSVVEMRRTREVQEAIMRRNGQQPDYGDGLLPLETDRAAGLKAR